MQINLGCRGMALFNFLITGLMIGGFILVRKIPIKLIKYPVMVILGFIILIKGYMLFFETSKFPGGGIRDSDLKNLINGCDKDVWIPSPSVGRTAVKMNQT